MSQSSSGLLIALSAGGMNNELAAHGLGVEHVEELMVRLSMTFLRNGHRLAFGGTLGDPDQPLTKILIDATQSWIGEDLGKGCYVSSVTRPETWPLVNYSAWPSYTKISEEQRASFVGICRFVNVDPANVPQSELNAADWPKTAQAKRFAADGLSAMRQLSARETDLRIMWGGKVVGAAGWMPGILEEFTYSCEYQKPVLILGGFGGCARLIADFMLDKKQDELQLARSAAPERGTNQTDSPRNDVQELFNKTQTRLTDFRQKLYCQEPLFGIPTEIIRKALKEESPRKVIRLAAEAAKACVDA